MLLLLNADMARDLVRADRCSIWLVDAASNVLRTRVAHGMKEIQIPVGSGLVGACISGDRPIIVNKVGGDERFLKGIDDASGYVTDSILVIPLRAEHGRVIGAIQLLNKPFGFTEQDVELVGLAAAYSASAIETQRLRHEAESARVLLRDMEIAREVQFQLLPRHSPVVPGLTYAAGFRPAKLVSGDYYDFFTLPDARFSFTLGDVSGKGVVAALLMASIQQSLRAVLQQAPDPLCDAITLFSQTVYESSAPDKYSTLFCGQFNPVTLSLTYVNAGGVPPSLLRRTGETITLEQLNAGGCPIGLLGGACYEQATVQLAPGDILLCCSDGLTEAMNSNEEIWDESQIELLLRESSGLTASEIVRTLIEAVDAFAAGADQSDDLTLLVLVVAPPMG